MRIAAQWDEQVAEKQLDKWTVKKIGKKQKKIKKSVDKYRMSLYTNKVSCENNCETES